MSRYVGYTGEAVIKEEFREDFINLYNRKFSKMKTNIMRNYVKCYGYPYLNIKSWVNDFDLNKDENEWDELLPTSYDEKTGKFSYGVFANFNAREYFNSIDYFIDILTQIADEVEPYKFYDELEEWTKKDIESMRYPQDFEEDIEIIRYSLDDFERLDIEIKDMD